MARKNTTRKAPGEIDREKLRAAIRRLGTENVYDMLDDAIELLPPTKRAKLASDYIDLNLIRSDPRVERSLRGDVEAFYAASRAGRYYKSFNVNSKNYTDTSVGTLAFITDCHWLFDRCVAEATTGDAAEVCESIEKLVALLRYIDKCNDDVLFFADEGGSWQVGVRWTEVLPAWFTCLSQTTEPADYARRVVEAIDEFDGYRRTKHLAEARRRATPAQRKALRAATLAVGGS